MVASRPIRKEKKKTQLKVRNLGGMDTLKEVEQTKLV